MATASRAMCHPRVTTALLLALSASPLAATDEGKIFISNDEWTLSDTGFASAPDTPTYVANVTSWFTGGAAGNFLAYSDNFGLTDNTLANTMTSLGHAWQVSTTITFDLPTLQQFDAVFLCGFPADANVLEDYVRCGGHLYIAGGARGPGGDAQLWNPLLGRFGLGFKTFTNDRIGTLPIDVNHPAFHGVTGLYQNNGTDTIDRNDSDCLQRILWSEGGNDLYAVYNNYPPLEFHAYSATLSAGDTLELTCGMGQAGKRAVLIVEDVDGVAIFFQVFVEKFGSNCRWDKTLTLTAGLPSIDVTCAVYGIGLDGKVQRSNPVVLSFP